VGQESPRELLKVIHQLLLVIPEKCEVIVAFMIGDISDDDKMRLIESFVVLRNYDIYFGEIDVLVRQTANKGLPMSKAVHCFLKKKSPTFRDTDFKVV
jgi:hypothetical protein